MAVVTTKALRISNAEAAVQTLDSVVVNHGRKRTVVALVSAVSGDSILSQYRFARVHSSWRVTSIKVFNDALGGTTAMNIGLYQTSANPNNGGAAVSATTYASALSLVAASTAGVEAKYQNNSIANATRQVWQDAGATADTNRWYELVGALSAAVTSTGNIMVEVEYVGND